MGGAIVRSQYPLRSTVAGNRPASRALDLHPRYRPMPSLARKNLLEDLPRFLVAQAGIVFAVSLVTIQTGTLQGFTEAASLPIDRSRADFWVTSKDFVHLEMALPMPFERVIQARQVPGVLRAEPLTLNRTIWRTREDQIESISLIGLPNGSQLFRPWTAIAGSPAAIEAPYTALVDRSKLKILKLKSPGDQGHIGSLAVRLVGTTEGARAIVFSPFVFVSLPSALTYVGAGRESSLTCKVLGNNGGLDCTNTVTPRSPFAKPVPPPPVPPVPTPADPITFVLVAARPGQDLLALQQRLRAALPETKVFTKAELARSAQVYWRDRTGVGFILSLGTVVGLIVGVAIVGQILYAAASDRQREFGTLKAMGASDGVLRWTIIEQALWMAILGYVPGLGLSLGVAHWAAIEAGVTIAITPLSALAVLGITVAMCVGASLFAIQKITRLDPALVFKS